MTYLSGCIEVADTADAAEDRRLSAKARGTGSADMSAAGAVGSAPSTAHGPAMEAVVPALSHVSHESTS